MAFSRITIITNPPVKLSQKPSNEIWEIRFTQRYNAARQQPFRRLKQVEILASDRLAAALKSELVPS